ncbi:MAG: response regulator [Candidatus Gastranaerophilales bacterium]|nr:response regulator [Candidatus Gastranaerophilales bacterium]
MTNKIMIIDDNETNVKLLDLVLTKAGFKTDTIINPKFAFDIIKETKPILILLDVNMPEVNGFQLCKMLKKDSETKTIPIIFVSSLKDVKYIAGGLAIGGADYITKPIKAEEVVARVSVQMQLALAQKKLIKTNEMLQKEILEDRLNTSDMQEDFLYSLMQIKNGNSSEKDNERIKLFMEFFAEKIIKSSQYSEDLTVDFTLDAILKSLMH